MKGFSWIPYYAEFSSKLLKYRHDRKSLLQKIYAHRDEIRSSNVVYYVCNEPGKSGHTSLLFAEDGTDNKLLMEEITDFLGQQ